MSGHDAALATTIGEIEEFLALSALHDLPADDLITGFAARARAGGLSVGRLSVAFRRLDPVFNSRAFLWTVADGAVEQNWTHEVDGKSPAFLNSPIAYLLDSDDEAFRCRLAGANAPLPFPILDEFAADGLTDYVIYKVGFGSDDNVGRPGGGVMISVASDRPGGFLDQEMAALGRIKAMLALAIRCTVQSDIGTSLAQTYLPRTASRRVLDGDIHLGRGRTIDAVVWYCDLRSSTALCDRLGTAAYLPFLNDFFAVTARPIVENGGDVLDFVGDAVLAIFPHDDRGVERALAATEGVRSGLAAFRERHDDIIGDRTSLAELIGVAIDIGPVVYGNIGIPERMAFSAIGATVNRVSRIERLTKVFGVPILATDKVACLAGEGWMSVGRPAIDGLVDPPELFACR